MSYQNIHPSFFSRKEKLEVIAIDNNKTNDSKADLSSLNVNKNFIVSEVSNQKMYSGDSISKLNKFAKNMFQKTDDTLLSFLFFSQENLQNIQALLKKAIFDKINYVVSEQSYDELIIVMRLIYLEYALQPPPIRKDADSTKRYALLLKNKEEINRLNGIVISMLLPKIISEITQYTYYLQDISKIAVKDFNPKFTSSKGEVELRSITQVLGA